MTKYISRPRKVVCPACDQHLEFEEEILQPINVECPSCEHEFQIKPKPIKIKFKDKSGRKFRFHKKAKPLLFILLFLFMAGSIVYGAYWFLSGYDFNDKKPICDYFDKGVILKSVVESRTLINSYPVNFQTIIESEILENNNEVQYRFINSTIEGNDKYVNLSTHNTIMIEKYRNGKVIDTKVKSDSGFIRDIFTKSKKSKTNKKSVKIYPDKVKLNDEWKLNSKQAEELFYVLYMPQLLSLIFDPKNHLNGPTSDENYMNVLKGKGEMKFEAIEEYQDESCARISFDMNIQISTKDGFKADYYFIGDLIIHLKTSEILNLDCSGNIHQIEGTTTLDTTIETEIFR